MGGWSKIESKYAKEISNLKKLVDVYDYSDKNAKITDKKIRDLTVFQLREIKTIMSNLMLVAYNETDDASKELKRVRDDIDLAIGEVGDLDYWKFPEQEDFIEKVVKADLVILNNMGLLQKTAKTIHSQVINAEKGNIQLKLETFRKMLSDSRAVFLERAEVIKIKR